MRVMHTLLPDTFYLNQIFQFDILTSYEKMILAFSLIELEVFKDTVWNSHKIPHQNETDLRNGVPDHVYAFPEAYGLEDCGMYYVNKPWVKLSILII